MSQERIWAGVWFVTIVGSVVLWFLPRWLSKKQTETLKRLFWPIYLVSLALFFIAFAGRSLLVFLGWGTLLGEGALSVVDFAFSLWPVAFLLPFVGWLRADMRIFGLEHAEWMRKMAEEHARHEKELSGAIEL